MAANFGTVLVVDDDVEIRETLTSLLQHEGYSVLRAENGVQALDQLRRLHPDVVLLDLMMPVMSGWEVIEELQDTGEMGRVPIVVVSAMGAPGACACLRKPVDLEELLEVVERCCASHAASAASAAAPSAQIHR
jgi:two-component system response regulator CpxR